MNDRFSHFLLPPKIEEQISRFTKEALLLHKAQSFDPYQVLKKLADHESHEVIGIELGGDKLTTRRYVIKGKTLFPTEDVTVFYSTDGKGYLKQLERIKENSFDIPVGISFAGPLDGEKIVGAPNMGEFVRELEEKYDRSLRKLFPSLTCAVNDSVAAIIPSIMSAALENEFLNALVLIINGSGLGGAIWYRDSDGGPSIISAEPGHIEVVEKLNLYQQDKKCGLLGREYVCIENLAASKAGIEDIYEKRAHIHLRGFEISELYQSGENLSTNLYNTSALLVAHTYMGMLYGARNYL